MAFRLLTHYLVLLSIFLLLPEEATADLIQGGTPLPGAAISSGIEYIGTPGNENLDGYATPTSTVPGTLSNSGCITQFGLTSCSSASVTTSYSDGDGLISASANASGAAGGVAYGTIAFYYEVVGPANISIPLDITATVSESVPDNGQPNYALAVLNAGDLSLGVCTETLFEGICESNGITPTDPATLSSTLLTLGVTNTIEPLLLNAACVINSDDASGSVSSCEASIDPMITIDPTFTDQGYSVVVSANPQLSTVPEPGTVALMAIGFISLITTSLCRRDKSLMVG